MTRMLSCGVLVTDGRHVLIGHATGSRRWDIPKGLAEPDEPPQAAALRELEEETGLRAVATTLISLGRHDYLPRKDLALFAWQVAQMPDVAGLVCRSLFPMRGRMVPEFDRFACPLWPDALATLGKSMAPLLTKVAAAQGWLGHGARDP